MFKNEVVLVTGSSRGIGKSIALAFAKHGAKVVLNGVSSYKRLQQTYLEFKKYQYKVMSFFGDVSDYAIANKLFQQIQELFGQFPTIIINNAGISHVGLFTETTPSLWQSIITTNLYSAYNCCHLGVPYMIQRQKGIIINISSIWGNVGASCEVAYSTSKAALNGFTKSLAKELGPSHIRVNAIACGWIDTDMNAHYTAEEKNAFIDEIPLCRSGNVTDITQACLFLASPYADYITSQILTIDGGLL